MSLLSTPLRLPQLDAWSPCRAIRREPVLDVQDSRMPDDAEVLRLQALAAARFGRIAAEVALAEGGLRFYAPRPETQVLDTRSR